VKTDWQWIQMETGSNQRDNSLTSAAPWPDNVAHVERGPALGIPVRIDYLPTQQYFIEYS